MTLGLEWDDAQLVYCCRRCGYGPVEEGEPCPNCRPAHTEPLEDPIDNFTCPVCGDAVVDLVCKRCGWDEYGGNIFVTSSAERWERKQAARAGAAS